jgi:ATP/maltotriose-dependent transcriptional regulator MalT
MFWGEAKLALGEGALAEEAMVSALPDLGEMLPVAAAHLARVYVRGAATEQAEMLVRRYLPLVADNPRSTMAGARAMLGDVAAALDDPESWETAQELLVREAFPIVMAYAPVSVQRVLGRLAARRKQWPEAISYFDIAVGQLRQGGARWELARTHLDFAEMRLARGKRGDANKAAAQEVEARLILEELGFSEPAHLTQDLSKNGNRFGLTAREREVLGLVAEGRRNEEIAEALSLAPGTVRRHLENIFTKMDARNRMEAVGKAVEEGIVGPFSSDASRPQRLSAG